MALCELSSGFLVPRQCENEATAVCSKCGRQICEAHSVAGEAGVRCTVCATGAGRYFDPATMLTAEDALLRDEDEGLFNKRRPGEEEDEDLS